MTPEIDLLELFECEDLDTLLQRSSTVFEQLGFPFLMMRWTPSASTDSAMISNSIPVWSNFSAHLGDPGNTLMQSLARSIELGLIKARENTHERQSWITQQQHTFRVAKDAPKQFHLTQYQLSLICDFGEKAWNDFVSHPLSRERDRLLLLDAMTQDPVTDEMAMSAQQVFVVFETIYRRLQTLAPLQAVTMNNVDTQDYLSHREIECLSWLAAGKTLHEAAIILDISERTLRFHIANARNRLGVATTMQAVVAAALLYGFSPNDARSSIYAISRASRLKSA